MRDFQPVECPACGHERLRRHPRRLGASSRSQRPEEQWSCSLCAYTWTLPSPPVLKLPDPS